jgi:hypothetical protein
MCLECGEPISAPENKPVESSGAAASLPSTSARRPARPRKRGKIVWALLATVLVAVFWAATSDNPFAQGLQELAGSRQDQTIVDTPFSISAHNFRYYKFSVTEGKQVAVNGRFTVASASPGSASGGASDSDIEVYVMSEAAFAVWQNGYATSNVYESGRVPRGVVQASPEQAGVYYLIFSNKFAPKMTKKVDADIVLRYKNWMPESWHSAGERFWKWFGL